MSTLLFIIYVVAGYWAANRTVYANSTLYGKSMADIYVRKLGTATFLGWALIPIALVKVFILKR